MIQEVGRWIQIAKFSNVKLSVASDTNGCNWNAYEDLGQVEICFILDSSIHDCRGKGVILFQHKQRGVAGFTLQIGEDLPVHFGMVDAPKRLTFKALYGFQHMYCMRFGSSEDAVRFWCQVSVLRLAAKQANAGHAIAIPKPKSLLEGTTTRAFLGFQEDRFLILNQLIQLAEANPDEFSPHSLTWAEILFGIDPNNATQNIHDSEEDEHEHSMDGYLVSTGSTVIFSAFPHQPE